MNDHFLKNMFGEGWAEKSEKIIINAIGYFILAAIVFVVWGGIEWISGKEALENAKVVGQKGSDHLVDLGSYGSYLQGTTASLWALAGFCIIFVAFLIQAVQFAEQRKQFKIQSNTSARQNFETSFFQMLGLHNEIVISIVEGKHTGRDCFTHWFESFKSGDWGTEYEKIFDDLGIECGKLPKNVPKDGIEKYLAFYKKHQGELGHYFRNLYHIFKFVDEAQALRLPNKDDEYKLRRRYTSLVRATLSQYELAFLFYNCASALGEEKFKPLVEEYGLLKNFNSEDLLKQERENYPQPFKKKQLLDVKLI